MEKNIHIDIIRIIAALMVLSCHVGSYIGVDMSGGSKGVQLFFIMSGYLTFRSLDKYSSILQYYRGRARRILPTYWICLLLIYLGDLLAGVMNGSLKEAFLGQCGPRFLRYVFMVQCALPSNNWEMWNSHNALWSMSCFLIFYLLAPFLYRIMNNLFTGIALLGVCIFSRGMVAQLIISNFAIYYPEEGHVDWFAYLNPISQLYCFLLGAVLAIAIKRRKENIYLFIISLCFMWPSMNSYQCD